MIYKIKGEKVMKKLLAILLTCIMTIGVMVIPVSADSIYYPCYEGIWSNTDSGNPVKLEIYNVTNSDMGLYFQYGQFAVYVNNAKINGTKVNGNYREEWEGGDFIVSGTITLDLGDKGIWLDWHPYENGRDSGVKGFMMNNNNFSYKTIQDSTIKVVMDGKQLSFDQNPVIMNDRVMVPIRAIAEAMGAEVSWNEVRKVGRVVSIKKGNKEISFYADETEYANSLQMSIYTEGQSKSRIVTLDSPITIYNDRTVVPVRAVSQAFDANVTWDGNNKTVNISTK